MNYQHAGAAREAFAPRAAEPRVVELEMRFRLMKNYNYLVIDPLTRQAVVVDPAWEIDKIDTALAEAGVSLSGILITHSHPDHVHLAIPLSEKYDCPVFMSKEEIAISGFDAGRLVAIDDSPLVVGGLSIEPIFTPGHTPGCMCYLIGDHLFTGDVLFAEGCGMCPDLEAAQTMYASLQRLMSRVGSKTQVYPGHSYGKPPGQTMAQLLKDNIYLHFKSKDSFAAFRMRSGQNRAKMLSFG